MAEACQQWMYETLGEMRKEIQIMAATVITQSLTHRTTQRVRHSHHQ